MFGTNEGFATNRLSRPDDVFAGTVESGGRDESDAEGRVKEICDLVGRAEAAGSAGERVAILRSLLHRMDGSPPVPGEVIARIDRLAAGSGDPEVLALGLRARVRARAAGVGLGASPRGSRESLDARLRSRHARRARRSPPRRIPAAALDLRYRVDWERPLGVGGQAASFAATERGTGRRVVIKRAHAPNSDLLLRMSPAERAGTVAEFRERFRREARALEIAREKGIPGVVRLVEHGELVDPFLAARAGAMGGTPYLVTERVEGRTLGFLLKAYPSGLPAAAALHWGAELLRILGDLHDARLLHRDVKPPNVMFERLPDTAVLDALHDQPHRVSELPRLVLVDFGAALSLRDPRLAYLGFPPPRTEDYAPLEQLQLELAERQGPWTDVYAAAVLLLDLLAGFKPRLRCFARIREGLEIGEPVDRTAALRRLLSGHRSSVVGPVIRALETWPDRRTRAARPLASALDEALRRMTPGGRRA